MNCSHAAWKCPQNHGTNKKIHGRIEVMGRRKGWRK